jgi:hypothetical protein
MGEFGARPPELPVPDAAALADAPGAKAAFDGF